MGALSGSMSASKFYVVGDLPRDLRRAFAERVRLRTFQPLAPDAEEEEAFGWCAMGQPLDLDLSTQKVFSVGYITLGLRWDRYRFPPAVVHAQLAQAAKAACDKLGRERLSKSEKTDLKQRVMHDLRRKYLPSMRAVDVVWNLDRQLLFFFSQSATLRDRLAALFELTFGLDLALDSPFMAATQLLPDAETRAALDAVTLTALHGGG
jgi:hypothetical protein